MARQQEVGVKVTADTKQAEQNIGRFQRGIGNLRKGFAAARTQILAVTAAIAGFVAGIRSAVQAANREEDAINALNSALGDLGGRTDEVSAALVQQAQALQQSSRFTSDAVIEAQAFLRTLGVQAEQLPQATQATVDLATALNIDLQSAARNVGRTVGGFAGELGEVIPELSQLSKEALQAGAGIEFLSRRFAGRAQQSTQTFSGRLNLLTKAFGDLVKAFGLGLTSSRNLSTAIVNLTRRFVSLLPVARELGLAVGDLARKLGILVDFITLGGFRDALRDVFRFFQASTRQAEDYAGTLDTVSEQTKTTEQIMRELEKTLKDIEDGWKRTNDVTEQGGDAIEEVIEPLRVEVDLLGQENEQLERQVRLRGEVVEVLAQELQFRGDFARQAAERRSGVNFDRTSIGRRIGTNDPIFGGLSGGAFSVSRTRAVANPDGTVSFV